MQSENTQEMLTKTFQDMREERTSLPRLSMQPILSMVFGIEDPSLEHHTQLQVNHKENFLCKSGIFFHPDILIPFPMLVYPRCFLYSW